MSTTPQTLADAVRLTDREIIRGNIYSSFICDYGIVKSIVDAGHIDVTHAVRPVFVTGHSPEPIVSLGVEVLYPASSSFSATYPLSVGDGVLLIGLKDYVKSTIDIEPSVIPTDFRHYSLDTLKAIPLSAVSGNAEVQVSVDSSGNLTIDSGNNKIAIKNALTSLYTILNDLISGIQGATYIPYPGGVAGPPVPIMDATTKIAQSLTELGELLQ